MGTRYEVLNEHGEVVNRILASAEFMQGNFQNYREEEVLVLPEVQRPAVVSRASAKTAMILSGMWQSVLDYADSIADPVERELAFVAIHDTQEWRQDSPFLIKAAAALGLTDVMVADLFEFAKTIKL